jgi:hypothetical protein
MIISFFRAYADENTVNRRDDLLLANFVRDRRKQLGMSICYAADLAGIEIAQWVALESGWVPGRHSNELYSIAGTLKVDTSTLLSLAGSSRTDAA